MTALHPLKKTCSVHCTLPFNGIETEVQVITCSLLLSLSSAVCTFTCIANWPGKTFICICSDQLHVFSRKRVSFATNGKDRVVSPDEDVTVKFYNETVFNSTQTAQVRVARSWNAARMKRAGKVGKDGGNA